LLQVSPNRTRAIACGKTARMQSIELSPIDRVRIRLLSRFSEETIERWYRDPDSVFESTDRELRLAAHAIGVPLPRKRRKRRARNRS
jgi:hypothetical protein